MNRSLEQRALKEIPELLAGWLEANDDLVKSRNPTLESGTDIVFESRGNKFLIEWKGAGTLPLVRDAVKRLQEHAARESGYILVVAVPFMGEGGKEFCLSENISWLDLSGNAHITAHNVVIHVEGKTNKFKNLGRPKNLFAPKSSRISRLLLLDPETALTQREIAGKTGLNETLVGRVVRELEKNSHLIRNEAGAVKPSAPNLLLDAWHEAYRFDKHLILPKFAAYRTGDAALMNLAEILERNKIDYAATGLAGSWLASQFASFRLTTFYVREMPSEKLLDDLKLVDQSSGANVWLVVPDDEGVFQGASIRNGVRCVHPVQLYLDLKGHPERSKEAAAAIREEYLNWEIV